MANIAVALKLEDWNRLLVDVLFPKGSQGTSRLFLMDEQMAKLIKKTGLTEKEVISALYHVTNAQEIYDDVLKNISKYHKFLKSLPEQVGIDTPNLKELLIGKQLEEIPPFLAHLVVIVHAYMSGEREGLSDNEVYETIANSIAQVLKLDNVHKQYCYDNLKKKWPEATSMRQYYIGTHAFKQDLGNHSPWGMLNKWTKFRTDNLSGGAVRLDTCGIKERAHGFVLPIKYHAPFLSEDIKMLEIFGRKLRGMSDVKHSSWTMLKFASDNARDLSKRARNTLNDAFTEKNEGAACFVKFVNDGFEKGPIQDSDEEPDESKSGPVTTPEEETKNTVELEVMLNIDYDGELIMSVRIVDTLESDDEFRITINGKEVLIPVDKQESNCSAPLENWIPQEMIGKVDLQEFYDNRIMRGSRVLKCLKSGAFQRTMQYRLGGWEEAEPSSNQKVLVLSKEKWVKEFVRDEDIRNLQVTTIQSIYIINKEPIYGMVGIWPIQGAVSTLDDFVLRGGVKYPIGRNIYIIHAPPIVVYSGSRDPHDFVVTQTNISKNGPVEKHLVFLDGGWALEPVEEPCDVNYKIVLGKEPVQESTIQLVNTADRWKEFSIKTPDDEYKLGDLALDPSVKGGKADPWPDYLEKVKKANARATLEKKGDNTGIEKFWISFEAAKNLIPKSDIPIDPVPELTKAEFPITPSTSAQTKPRVQVTHFFHSDFKHCDCIHCTKQRYLMRNPNDNCAWKSYGNVETLEDRKRILADIKGKYYGFEESNEPNPKRHGR